LMARIQSPKMSKGKNDPKKAYHKSSVAEFGVIGIGRGLELLDCRWEQAENG
jgi:hypothetical protein